MNRSLIWINFFSLVFKNHLNKFLVYKVYRAYPDGPDNYRGGLGSGVALVNFVHLDRIEYERDRRRAE
ncbi:MAG: hypothetical protein KKB74_02365 [Bacteroidetes bacterium]|nr:hypothetical protein [Bacteroidota bacterium]